MFNTTSAGKVLVLMCNELKTIICEARDWNTVVGKVGAGVINHCGGLGVEELVQFVKIDVVVDCDQSSFS